MKTLSQLAESVARFQRVFWDKRSGERPPVGVVNPEVYLPIKYLRGELTQTTVEPADLTPELAATDYEFVFARPKVTCDDGMPFSAAWRAIPWLEAACGCPVRAAAGSLAPGHCIARLADLADAPVPARPQWLDLLESETRRLVAAAPADCWISPTILRGPADVLAAMRGLSEFYCDLHDDLPAVVRAAGRVNRLLLTTLERHFRAVPPKFGGYGHIFGYWAPGPTIAIQEDQLGACSSAMYRELCLPLDAEAIAAVAPYGLFHLHSTGCRHWRDVLSIPRLAGVQLVVESNGPRLADMTPMLREILEQSRLVLLVDSQLAELPSVLRRLPREGLFVVLRDDDIRTNDEYDRFVASVWADSPRVWLPFNTRSPAP